MNEAETVVLIDRASLERDYLNRQNPERDTLENERRKLEEKLAGPRPHAMGSPLPMGNGRRASHLNGDESVKRLTPPPPGRGVNGPESVHEEPSGVQRAMNLLRSALPVVQRLLPLLDGNIATAVTSLLSPHPHSQVQAPAPVVDLAPLKDGMVELQTKHRELRDQILEQNNSLKRVEDQLEMVREATDRNTLEQQELLEDLKSFGKKARTVVIIALGLVTVSIILNVVLFLHIQKVLP